MGVNMLRFFDDFPPEKNLTTENEFLNSLSQGVNILRFAENVS